jgi:hypothetical protein
VFVQIISKNNIDNLLGIDKYQKNSLVVFHSSSEIKQLNRYLEKIKEKYGNSINITSIKYSSLEDLSTQIKKLKPKYFQFNDLKIAESLAIISGIDRDVTEIVFYDSDSMNLINYKKNKIESVKKKNEMLEVSDYIELAGGDVELDNNDVFDRLIDDGSLNMILDDFERWRRFSRAFVDPNVVVENETRPLVFTVKFKAVDRRLIKYFQEYIDHFVEKDYFRVIADNMDRTIYRFTDASLKSFFKLSGSWLELITYKAVEDLKLDDIDASVLFTWDNEVKNFENEIDVLATKNGKLVVISCKDTKKVNKEYLNEIIVNSSQLGDDNVIKALATTSKLINESFFVRAKELNIAIIRYDGDFEEFKKSLKEITK